MNTPGVRRTFELGLSLATCVTTASEAAARDLATIDAGTPSFTLMLQAGTRATEVILRDYDRDIAHGAIVFAGPGNNGGDAYIVAAQLAQRGVRILVVASHPPRTTDAIRAAALLAEFANDRGVHCTMTTGHDMTAAFAFSNARLIIDGLLGTGHEGELRGAVSECVSRIAAYRERGATVVSLDVPSGLNASTGERANGGVCAHVTVSFGTIKRGALIDRAAAGRVVLVDIGLGSPERARDNAWRYATGAYLSSMLSLPSWNDYKNQRGQLAIIGGAMGMAGAVALAARGALHSGVGLVRSWVDRPSLLAVQSQVPQAMASEWETNRERDAANVDADSRPLGTALVIGPGLGRSARSYDVLHATLAQHWRLPKVIDADALTLLAAHPELDKHWHGRPAVLTPHAGEFARLTGAPTPTVWQERADALMAFVEGTGTTVLLKGTPTLVGDPSRSTPVVIARGTPVLATGGSGDLLSGIIGALLAQGLNGDAAAIVGAHVHGRAAEHATVRQRSVRGVTLDDVVGSMPHVWREIAHAQSLGTSVPGVLEDLPFYQEPL